jgi:predicted N-formylglutamate amidohydrolase
MNMQTKWIITCEHGGNAIPKQYQPLFADAQSVLETHRGYDIGALAVARALAKKIADFQQITTTSRLFVELNRSQGSAGLWSEFTRPLSQNKKNSILDNYYFPYRDPVEDYIAKTIKSGHKVIHLSIHSFTPVMQGVTRTAEIGILYDPTRKPEKAFGRAWQTHLQQLQPSWRIRCNYPYLGTSDGFITYLRKHFQAKNYIGIELEMNQGLLLNNPLRVKKAVIDSVVQLKTSV